MAKTRSSIAYLIHLLLWGIVSCHAPQQQNAAGQAERIISTVLLGDDFLIDLLVPEQLERVVGLSTIFESYALMDTQQRAQGVTSARFNLQNIEAIVAAQPDVVLVGSFSEPVAYAQLERFGIRVQVLEVAVTLSEIVEQLRLMGQLLERWEQAERLIEEMVALEGVLARNRKLLTEQLSILDFNAYGVSAGPNTSLGLVFSLAGLHNSATELLYFDAIGYAPLGHEALFKLDPDFLLCDEATAQLLSKDQRFMSLKAVQQGRVLISNFATRQLLFSPNRHLLSAVLWLQQQVMQA
jgi:iron complex transport system substrate-binding protein